MVTNETHCPSQQRNHSQITFKHVGIFLKSGENKTNSTWFHSNMTMNEMVEHMTFHQFDRNDTSYKQQVKWVLNAHQGISD